MDDKPIEELEPATTVSLSIADLHIREAVEYVADGDAHYILWMPSIIDKFRCTYAEYWDLTVAEHATFVEYLEASDGV